jgi:cobalt-zinc-cadmium efflux system membrane fusion protein
MGSALGGGTEARGPGDRQRRSVPDRYARLLKPIGLSVLVLVVVGLLVAAMPLFGLPHLLPWNKRPANESAPGGEPEASAQRVPGRPDTVRLPPDVVRALGIQTVEAKPATQPRLLQLSGKLALDANHLARVHARFGGEVMEIAQVPDVLRPGERTQLRDLRPGDGVEQNQLLAVVWSKDLGEKKSELVDALSKLRLDRETLKRYQDLYDKGAIPERSLREAERNVEADLVAVAKAERTLASWRLTDEEIAAVRAEAERLGRPKDRRDKEKDKDWAKVEVRARFPGTVVEKNVAVGDIVDTATDLFKVADLRTLAVWADAYEEDLPALLALPAGQRRWKVRLKADPDAPPREGPIDYVGEIIDPNQHTALVAGRVDNPEGLLRAGQFVTAVVEFPPPPHEVVVPATALIDDGRTSVLFVQEDPDQPEFTLRRVVVQRRLPEAVTVRDRLTPQQERQGLRPVRPGEHVVSRGAVELKKALEETRAADKPPG